MGSSVIVFLFPAFNQDLGFSQSVKDLAVQQFIVYIAIADFCFQNEQRRIFSLK